MTATNKSSGFIGWLITAGVFGVVWLGTWATATPPKATQTTKTADITSQDLPLPKKIENFTQFSKEVPVLDVSSTLIRDLRNYPAEFKDKKYFEKHKRSWTMQVMDVAEHDIITGYLKGRTDRDKFAYFRYKNKAGESRYILTYGLAKSSQDATNMAKAAVLGLPATVVPVPEKMERYLSMIDTYERNDDIVDLAPNAPRKIRLQATKSQVPPATPKEVSKPSTSQSTPQPVKPQNTAPRPKPVEQGEVSYGNTNPRPSTNNNTSSGNRGNENRQNDTPVQQKPKPKPQREAVRENQPNDTVEYKAHGKVEYTAKKENEHAPKTEHKLKTEHKAETRPEHKSESRTEHRPKPEHKPKEPVSAPITNTPSTPGSD